MQKSLARLVIPAVLALLTSAPAFAQIRLGVDLGGLSIRISPDAPPPPRREVVIEAPSRNHVWVEGCWERRGDRWAWAPGRWELPPQRGSVWIRSQYLKEGGAYRYEPAHWSHQQMVEGDDYQRWHRDHARDHDRREDDHRDHDRREDDRRDHDREDRHRDN